MEAAPLFTIITFFVHVTLLSASASDGKRNECFPCECIDGNTQMYCENTDIYTYPAELSNNTKSRLINIIITYTNIVNLPFVRANEYLSLQLFMETNNYILACDDVRQWYSVIDQATFTSNCVLPDKISTVSDQTDFTTVSEGDNTSDVTTNWFDVTPITTDPTDELLTISTVDDSHDGSVMGKPVVLSFTVFTIVIFMGVLAVCVVYVRRRKQQHRPYRDSNGVWIEMDQSLSHV